MQLDLETIQSKFDSLLNGTESREEVSKWALYLREAYDRDELEFTPRSDESRLWEALTFLEGVDLKDAPDSYLHSVEDIMNAKP